MRLTPRESLCAAVQSQVVESDVDQETQPVGDVLDDLGCHLSAPAAETHAAKELESLAHRQVRNLRQAATANEDKARCAAQSSASALGARSQAEVLGELLAYGGRLGLAVAPLEVGENAFERMALARHAFSLRVAELDELLAAALEQYLLNPRGELVPGRLDVELEVARE